MLIGICGRKMHGKDTAALVIPGNFAHLNFSDPVKDLCMRLFGLTREECYNQELKEKVLTRYPYKSPRFLMQYIGDGLRKDFPDIWVNKWIESVGNLPPYDRYAFATDVRYPNEAKAIQSLKGRIIKIVRPGVPENEYSQNASETSVDLVDPDIEIINDGTIDELQDKVRDYLRGLQLCN